MGTPVSVFHTNHLTESAVFATVEAELFMKTIHDWSTHLRLLYGHRNECYLQGLSFRITFLILGIRMLRRAIRAQADRATLAAAAARVMARVFTVAHHFDQLPLVEAVAMKYGNGCAYCQKDICGCRDEARPEPVLRSTETMRACTLTEMRDRLNRTYGEGNRGNGVWWILDRLSDEVTELIVLEACMRQGTIDTTRARQEFANELADVMAWIMAIVNFYGLDLDTAMEERYGGVCWKCHTAPCACPPYVIHPELYQ